MAKRDRNDIAPKVAVDAAYRNARENTSHTARLAHDRALAKVMQHLVKDCNGPTAAAGGSVHGALTKAQARDVGWAAGGATEDSRHWVKPRIWRAGSVRAALKRR